MKRETLREDSARFHCRDEALVWVRSASRGFILVGLAQLVGSLLLFDGLSLLLGLAVLGVATWLRSRPHVTAAGFLAIIGGVGVFLRLRSVLGAGPGVLNVAWLAASVGLAWIAFRAWRATQYLEQLARESTSPATTVVRN